MAEKEHENHKIRDKITLKSINSLKLYDKNTNKHSESQIELLMSNIKEFGFTVPLITDKNDIIIAGHGRWVAAKRLGIKKLPCIVASDLTETQVKALRIADNKISSLGELDHDLLKEEFHDLNDSHFNMDILGFDDLGDYFKPEQEEEPEDDKTEKVDKLGSVTVTCPECGHKFQRK